MSFLSKLNFRAVDAAYKDVAALSFVTFLSIQCKHECQHLGDVVDLQRIAQRVAEENARDIINVSTGRMETDAALLRFGQVVRGLTKELKSEVGARPTVGDLLQILDKFFDLIALKVLQSARRGYLNIGLSDADYFVTKLRLTMIDSASHFSAVSQIIEEAQAPSSDYPGPDEIGHGSPRTDSKPSSDIQTGASRSREDKRRPTSDAYSSDAVASSGSPRVIREIDRRPNRQGYTGIWDHNDAAAKVKKTPSNPNTQPPKPRAHNVRDEPKAPPQALRTSFCSPVTIESPSRAIRGEKLVEDVGLVTSSGDFIAILDKFSWLPHSRTLRIPLATPTEEPVTVTFARRRSAFGPERMPLGTFLLTGFSGDDAVPNVLEIRVSAEDSELYFDVRDAAGSHLTITRQS